MNNETEPLGTPKPLMPIWASIPLYFIASVIFMFAGVIFILPFQLFSSDSMGFVIGEQIVTWMVSAAAYTTAALLLLKYIDRTSTSELGLSIRGRGKDILLGIIWAIVLYIIGFGVSLWLGAIKVTSISLDWGILSGTFVVYFFVSLTEEVMIRGYVQGRLMTRMNKFAALGIASLIFAALHIPNPNMGLFPLANLFLAGVMLGASCLYTRNLWFPIALHLAWNWIQGSVLGYEVSGTKMFPSALNLHLPEENILNGGSFGFEGSIICTILMVASIAVIIAWGESKIKKQKHRD